MPRSGGGQSRIFEDGGWMRSASITQITQIIRGLRGDTLRDISMQSVTTLFGYYILNLCNLRKSVDFTFFGVWGSNCIQIT
jgi:hypothetical protein